MSRLIVVSNRVAPIEEGKASAGGLSVAVEEAFAKTGGLWFGWNGKIENSGPIRVKVEEGERFSRATMPLSRKDYNDFYVGYSNSTLWPLLHYRLNVMQYSRAHAEGYRRVNELFAHHLEPLLESEDRIWVHDYHLFILGRELKRMGLRNRMGFFLHTPFPPPDMLRSCSEHEEIVKALFDYDVVGFQTENDARNLLEYVRRLPGGTVRGSTAHAFGKSVRVQAFPISIRPDDMAEAAEKAVRSNRARQLVSSLGGKQLVIGVERLDYSKGLDRRFSSYERLLANYPENRGSVTFMQIAPPSRGDVQIYREIRQELEGIAGHINGRYAEFDWVPIRYLNKSYRREVLAGFFRIARVGCVTPLRDGMNLVAKEYVASQDPADPGVLVLSEFAGAAAEMDGAVIVNPFDEEGMMEGLQTALRMPLGDRVERYQSMMSVLRQNDLQRWRRRFLEALASAPRRS
ncbi:trehalose-6-phosphate synthase [Nisaea acidiphila]|uniref:Trehalose-6-phosphate synthase n=1 Tax=Nisaea acidiphila TaxID=1862145 RepID=A0A9J7AW90_9PROT|nr:trehalose-6-phosphate synthase [Nisaea acidiphila]UUX50713.1 trehalose-6-phosphate synthase [Nisaea acidiphila]